MLKNLVCSLLPSGGQSAPCCNYKSYNFISILGLACFVLLGAMDVKAQSALRVKQDTVRIVNANLVIENPTKNILGFLHNEGNGVTAYRKLDLVNIGDSAIAIAGQDTLKMSVKAASGKSIQFKAGVSVGYPTAGQQVYTNTDFLNRNLKVWRNGLFQYRDSTDGILVDSVQGKLTFNPALAQGDRIYIEALGGIELVAALVPATGITYLTRLAAGVFFNSETSLTLKWATNNTTLSSSPKVVGVGSSTLAGVGANAPDRLGDKIGAWLNLRATTPTWINLAVGGYKSSNMLPTAMGGTAGANIDSALNANPDFIFVSLPSNDAADGITAAQFMTNLRIIDTMAANRGVPVFFETTQPRTGLNATQQTLLKVMADSVRKAWPTRYVEGFTSVVDNSASTDAVIKTQYSYGDNIHLNAAGQQLIADSLFDRWTKYFTPIAGITSYTIDTSANQSTWAQYDQVSGANTVKKVYTKAGSNPLFYRVRAQYTDGSYSAYSNVVRLYKPTTTTPPVSQDYRVLIDLGGDGVTTYNSPENKFDGQTTASPDGSGKYWNNFIGAPAGAGFDALSTFNGLVTTNNTGTTMGISVIGRPEGNFGSASTKSINYNGPTVAVGDYPASAVRDNMFLDPTIGINGVVMRIRGLIPTNTYSVRLWGARLTSNTADRVLEAKLSTEDWSVARSFNGRYAEGATTDYNRALLITGITGKDSIDINLRVKSGSIYAHVSVVDIGITGTLPVPPTVALRDTTATLPKDSLQIAGNINTNGTAIASYQWTQVSGPSTATFSAATSATTYLRGLTNGVYVFKLTATNTAGNAASAQTTVTVYPDNEGKKTLRVHFSRNAVATIPGWLNVYGNNMNSAVVSRTDATTSWTISSVRTGDSAWTRYGGDNASDADGQSTGNNSGIVPDRALLGYWFNFSTSYTIYSNVQVTGLNPSKTYTIKMVGSRSLAGSLPTYYSGFRVNGGSELLLNVKGNTATQTVVSNATPDSSGKIGIAVYRPSSGSLGDFAYINALIIQEN